MPSEPTGSTPSPAMGKTGTLNSVFTDTRLGTTKPIRKLETDPRIDPVEGTFFATFWSLFWGSVSHWKKKGLKKHTKRAPNSGYQNGAQKKDQNGH